LAFDPFPFPDPNITTGSVFGGQVIQAAKGTNNIITAIRSSFFISKPFEDRITAKKSE
jgi:hypothetical protein